MKNICFVLIFFMGIFIYYGIVNQAPAPRYIPGNLYNTLSPDEQKIIRVMVFTLDIYKSDIDYGKIDIKKIESNYKNQLSKREKKLVDIQKEDFKNVRINFLEENKKIVTFIFENINCLNSYIELENTLIKLEIISNSTDMRCTKEGFWLKSSIKNNQS